MYGLAYLQFSLIPSIATQTDDLKGCLWCNGSHFLSCFGKEGREKENDGLRGTYSEDVGEILAGSNAE